DRRRAPRHHTRRQPRARLPPSAAGTESAAGVGAVQETRARSHMGDFADARHPGDRGTPHHLRALAHDRPAPALRTSLSWLGAWARGLRPDTTISRFSRDNPVHETQNPGEPDGAGCTTWAFGLGPWACRAGTDDA